MYWEVTTLLHTLPTDISSQADNFLSTKTMTTFLTCYLCGCSCGTCFSLGNQNLLLWRETFHVTGEKSPNLSNTLPQRKITVRGMTCSHILEGAFSTWMTLRLFLWTLLQVGHKSILRSKQASLRFLIVTKCASEEATYLHRQTTLQASITVRWIKI